MKKVFSTLLLAITFSLAMLLITPKNAKADFVAPEGNLVANYDIETDTTGYTGNGCTIEMTDEAYYSGSHSLKLTGRTDGWNGFNIDTVPVELGEKYVYSFYVMTKNEGGADVQTTLSPWAQSSNGAWLWVYVACPWTHVAQNEWVELTYEFEIRLVEGKIYMVTVDDEGDESFQLIKNQSGDEDDYATFACMRLSCAATADAELYIDCVTLSKASSSQPVTPVDPEPFEPVEFNAPEGNLYANYNFEENIEPAWANGATLAHSTEKSYSGNGSMEVTGRTTGTWNAYNIDITTIELGQKYKYSFYALTTKEGGADIQAGYSPWGKSAAGNYIWYYGAGSWMHINQNEWAEVTAEFELRVVEGKLYVVTVDAEGEESFSLAKDYNGTDEDYDHLDNIRLSLAATIGADLYIDCLTLSPIGGEPVTPVTPVDPEPVDQPTGHAGGEDASLVAGNMIQNATFDTKMFSKELTNSGVWYYSSPEKVEIYDEYSQDGTDSGSCAHLYNRQNPVTTFMCRTLNIWVLNQYTLSGYVSAREATKGAFIIRMWAYYDEYTDENPVQRYPFAELKLDYKDLIPGEWTYFEVTFGWHYDDATGILTLQVYDYESKEIIGEYSTTECTGLSTFEFRFGTDPSDENYLTDLYFDNYKLMKVTEHFMDEPTDPTDPSDPGTTTEEPVVVVPDKPTTTEKQQGGETTTTSKKKGCKSELGLTLLPIAIISLTSLIFIRKKKEE